MSFMFGVRAMAVEVTFGMVAVACTFHLRDQGHPVPKPTEEETTSL